MSKGVKRDVFGAVGHIGVKEGVLGVLGDQEDQGAKRKSSGCRGVKATVIGSQRVKEDLPEAPWGQR